MDLIHVPLRHKYPALKRQPKKWLGRPMDTHLKKNGGASKWSLVKKEPLYTHRFYSCILIFAGRMLICESMSIKEPFQVPGSLCGYQALPTETKVWNMFKYMIYINTCFKQWFRRCSEVESNHYLFALRRQHLEHATMQPCIKSYESSRVQPYDSNLAGFASLKVFKINHHPTAI